MRPENRWRNLDFEPPLRQGGGEEESASAARASERPIGPAETFTAAAPSQPTSHVEAQRPLLPAVVTQANGAYMLRNYPAVLDLLEAPLREQPDLPGGQRTLGLALARLQRESEAVARLRTAVSQSPTDWLARAALSSLLLSGRDAPDRSSGPSTAQTPSAEAIGHLRAARCATARPAIRELLGAACWRVGQEALGAGGCRDAAAQFAAAAAEFTAAAEASGAARLDLPERQTVTFIGQAVALLLADELAAAQALFARSPLRGGAAGRPLARFAAGLYELCEELARAPDAERSEAAASLRDLLLSLRLEVGFYDGRQAVSLAWTGGFS